MKLLVTTCISDRSEVGLYKGFAARGVEVVNLCDPDDSAFEDFLAHGIQTEKLRIKNRFDFRAVAKIKEVISANRFDGIYTPTSRGLTAVLRATKSNPVPIVSYRGTMGNLHPWNPIDRMAHLSSRVARIVANCQAVKKFLRSVNVPEFKIRTVYKGHDPKWYQVTHQVALHELGIPSDAFKIACVAKLRPLKGVKYVIEALQKLVAQGINAHLLLVGELDHPELLPLTQRLGLKENVHFLGFYENVQSVVSQCDVSVMASTKREGVARAIIESMALGVPSVVTAVGGLPEVIQHEQSGLIVPPCSAEDLYEAFKALHDNPDMRNEFGKNARKDFETRFQLDYYVDEMLAVMNEAIGNQSPKLSSNRIAS